MRAPQMSSRAAEIQREAVTELDLRKNKQNGTSMLKTALGSASDGVFWVLLSFCQQLSGLH